MSLGGGRGLKAVPHVNPRLSDYEGLVHAITYQLSVGRCEAGRKVNELPTMGTQIPSLPLWPSCIHSSIEVVPVPGTEYAPPSHPDL